MALDRLAPYRQSSQRLVFPLFNVLIGAMFGAAIGYYVFRLAAGVLIGSLIGLLIGLGVEFALGQFGTDTWLYRRRVLLVAILEIPIAVMGLGPYAFVVVNVRPDQHPICCETPLDYGAAEYEQILVETEDGTSLAGWYIPPRETPGPLIVLLHGSMADRRGTAWHARQLLGEGYGVLMYDQRGLGESTGDKTSPGWDAPDLLSVLDYLNTRPEVDPERIGVVGLSGGGYIALNAAYVEPDRMYALWLDGIQAQRIEDYPEAQDAGERFATFINSLVLKWTEVVVGRPSPPAFRDILPGLERPAIVMVAAGQDDFERRVNEIYAGLIGKNVEMWLIEDAWHVGGPIIIPDEYSRRMLDFFENAGT